MVLRYITRVVCGINDLDLNPSESRRRLLSASTLCSSKQDLSLKLMKLWVEINVMMFHKAAETMSQ